MNKIRLLSQIVRKYSGFPYIRAVTYVLATAGHKDCQNNTLDNPFMACTAAKITAL